MHIYAIYDTRNQAFVRFGVNGGGEEGYCLYRGHKCFWNTRKAAQSVIDSFDRPGDCEIREFAEVEE